jgi:hypothetical protein
MPQFHMPEPDVRNLTAFVPAKDFALSRRFYHDLGFAEVGSFPGAVRFEKDGFGFWLQDYYVEDWANNFMFCLYTNNLDAWSARIRAMPFETYGCNARILAEPHLQDGKPMMQLVDPSGVLWHIRQT